MNVVFVYEERGGPTRYRVHNQLAQARYTGLEAQALPLVALGRRPELGGVNLLYLHRLRLTTQTLPLLLVARLRRIPVVYDSDDLIWDRRLRQYERLDARHPPATVRQITAEIRRARWLMALADALVLSTPYLADLARATFKAPVYVHANALGPEQLAASEAALARTLPHEGLLLAHFSGSAGVHDDDLAAIGEALRATLDAHPAARLLLVGETQVPPALSFPPYAQRVLRRPPVDWQALPTLIASVDVNLAPLLDNPQRRAKSAVKYLEAAAVAVPTLAARLDPYSDTIADGVTGLLAGPTEWATKLRLLADDSALRCRLGEAARAHVLAEHTFATRAPAFRRLLEQIRAAHSSR